MATVKTNVIQIETRQAEASIKELRKSVKSFQDQMAGLDPHSDAFKELAKQAGEAQHQIDEVRQAVKGASADFGDILGNVGKVGAGITGAFQTAQAAMNLFGVESENVTKSIQKMQSLMAITQGLGSIDEANKALSKLEKSWGSLGVVLSKTIKIAAPIAGWAAAIVATTTAIVALNNRFGAGAEIMRERTKRQNEFNDALARELAIRNKAGESEINNIKFEIETLSIRNSKLKEENQGFAASLKAVQQTAQGAQSAAAAFGTAAAGAQAYNQVAKDSQVNTDALSKSLMTNNAEIKKNDDRIEELRKELDILEEAQRRVNKTNKDAKVTLEDLQKAYEGVIAALVRQRDAELKVAGDNEELKLKIIKNYSKKIIEVKEDELKNVRQFAYKQDLKNLQDLYDSKTISTENYYDNLKQLDAQYMLDWGSYQAAYIARFNRDIVETQQKALEIISVDDASLRDALKPLEEYYDKYDELTIEHYNKIQIALKDLFTVQMEAKDFYEAVAKDGESAFNNTTKFSIDKFLDYRNELMKFMKDVYPAAMEGSKEFWEDLQKVTAERSEAYTRQLNDIYRELTNVNTVLIAYNRDALNYVRTLEDSVVEEEIFGTHHQVRALAHWRTAVAKQIAESEAESMKIIEGLRANDLIGETVFEEAKTAIVEKATRERLQLRWDEMVEQNQVLDEWGAAWNNVGSAILAVADARKFQMEQDGKFNAEEQKRYEESLDKAKGFNIAGVVISTLAGIANATASIWSPNNAYLTVWGQAGMQAAITVEMLANMAAQIAQIKQQTGSSKASLGSISSSATSSLIAPVAYTNSVQGASERNARDTRVYVTEHDITDTQRRVQVAQSEARF